MYDIFLDNWENQVEYHYIVYIMFAIWHDSWELPHKVLEKIRTNYEKKTTWNFVYGAKMIVIFSLSVIIFVQITIYISE